MTTEQSSTTSPPEVYRLPLSQVPFTYPELQPLVNNQLQDMAENVNILQAIQTIQDAITGIEEQRQNPTTQGLKLKHFHGYPSEDIEDWITKFNDLAQFNNWQDIRKARALPFYLDGLASTYFSHLPQATKDDSDTALDALRARFSTAPVQFLLRQELNKRHQGKNESLEDYTEDIYRRCHRLNINGNEMRDIFVQGLSPALKAHVIITQPQTMEEAVTSARLKNAVLAETSEDAH